MDVVKNNIQKLNGRIEIESVPGNGTTFRIALPLTLSILPVLVVTQNNQPFAVPLSLVHEIIPLETAQIRPVGGRATMVVRDDVLPVRTLATLLGREQQGYPRFGVLMQSALGAFILAVDGYVGREDVVIKPLEDVKPRGIAGATLSGSGSVVLVLDMQQLFDATPGIHDERMLTAAAA
jgi:two-component system, chemotaxis family, sensor kinase CheA